MTTEQKETAKEKKNKAFAKAMGGELVELKIEMFSPFVDFLKEYMSFFGAKKTLEDLCREMIYEQAEYLYNELDAFANSSHYIDREDWTWRFSHMAVVSPPHEDAEETEDC
jgi:hypothetical protein